MRGSVWVYDEQYHYSGIPHRAHPDGRPIVILRCDDIVNEDGIWNILAEGDDLATARTALANSIRHFLETECGGPSPHRPGSAEG